MTSRSDSANVYDCPLAPTMRHDVSAEYADGFADGQRYERWQWWDALGREGHDGPTPSLPDLRGRTHDRLHGAFVRGFFLGALVAMLLGLFGFSVAVSAQGHPTTTETVVPAGTWFWAIKAFNQAGLHSGFSNEVQTVCTPVAPATTCAIRLMWDANTESDLAGYQLWWGPATGVYGQSKAIPVTLTPGKLPMPTLRLRRTP